MNYAENRRDRRARQENVASICHQAMLQNHHTMLADALKDLGWNDHALFHYYVALIHTTSWTTVGDFATMCSLAGDPQLGVVTLFIYCQRIILDGETTWPGTRLPVKMQAIPLDKLETNLLSSPPKHSHCGCRIAQCGQSPRRFLESTSELPTIMRAFQDYHETVKSVSMPNATKISNLLVLKRFQDLPDCQHIPILLQFWKHNNDLFPPILQVLLLKLLYETLPCLAAEAVIQISPETANSTIESYKSHHAYYVLIRALVLGERIKPHRRHLQRLYHVPIWDILWGHDQRNDIPHISLENYRSILSTFCTDPLKPLTSAKAEYQSLYVVGDSHVLSIAYQVCCVRGQLFILWPLVVTGLKAWHCRAATRFFTATCLQRTLGLLNAYQISQPILLSAGEIDCREGVGGEELQGYTSSCHNHIQRTVNEFVHALEELDRPVLVLPVAPHAFTKKGRVTGQTMRREAMYRWNHELRTLLPSKRVFFLDYWEQLCLPDTKQYTLKPILNADSTVSASRT